MAVTADETESRRLLLGRAVAQVRELPPNAQLVLTA